MTRAASIARQALERGLAAKVPFFVTPGSDQIYQTCKRDGILDVFERAGGTVLANACGPCIGQWDRRDVPQNEPNSILTSFNRNFAGRNDGNKYTHNFLCSPEVVTAMAFSGDLSFNPMTDALEGREGVAWRFGVLNAIRSLSPSSLLGRTCAKPSPKCLDLVFSPSLLIRRCERWLVHICSAKRH
jgi:aconitase A